MKKNEKKGIKSYRLFRRVWSSSRFQASLSTLRIKVGIPKNGFEPTDEGDILQEKWIQKITTKNRKILAEGIISIAKKFQLPVPLLTVIETKLYDPSYPFNTFVPYKYMCDLERDDNLLIYNSFSSDRIWKKIGIPFVKIYISDYAGLDDAQEFISDNWKIIQRQLDLQRGSKLKPKMKTIKNFRLRDFIYNIYELYRGKGPKKGGMDNYVSRIATKLFKKKITPENVRKIISEERKYRDM